MAHKFILLATADSTTLFSLHRMAGIGAVVQGLRDGHWYRCSNGKLVEPLDILHLLFPNVGRNSSDNDVCFVPRHLTFSPLRALLPDPTGYFVPDDLVDSIVALTILCVLVTVGLILCKLVWEKVDPRFAAISPPHKKWYVVANLFKAFFLACLAISSRYVIQTYKQFFLDEFRMIELKRCTMIYVVTDVVALYMVPRLPRSTVLHHIATTTLCLTVSSVDMTVKGWGGLLGVSKMTILYGTFSSIAYPVNAYLALRVVYRKAKWLDGLVNISLWTYVACCAGNWSVHAVWLVRAVMSFDVSVATLLYLVAVSTMVHDDIVLIRWLWSRGSPMAEKQRSQDGYQRMDSETQ